MTLKQLECIQEWDLIGMVSFTWYFDFQKLKKEHLWNLFLVLQQFGNGKVLLLNSCLLIPAKYVYRYTFLKKKKEKGKKKQKQKNSCSAEWFRFGLLELKSELDQTFITKILFIL